MGSGGQHTAADILLADCQFGGGQSIHFFQGQPQFVAAKYVVYSSTFKAGAAAKVAVDTTEVKNIWKANGAKPGMVLYEVYTTVYVTPREGLEEQLKKK